MLEVSVFLYLPKLAFVPAHGLLFCSCSSLVSVAVTTTLRNNVGSTPIWLTVLGYSRYRGNGKAGVRSAQLVRGRKNECLPREFSPSDQREVFLPLLTIKTVS